MMRWQAGPKNFGCVYHQRAVRPAGEDSVVVDVFIMPKILRRRPIAVTIGRYRNYKAVAKADWQLRRPEDASEAGAELTGLFEKIGVPPGTAADLAAETQRFIKQEASSLAQVLASLSAKTT
jgi:hypothetical protein